MEPLGISGSIESQESALECHIRGLDRYRRTTTVIKVLREVIITNNVPSLRAEPHIIHFPKLPFSFLRNLRMPRLW